MDCLLEPNRGTQYATKLLFAWNWNAQKVFLSLTTIFYGQSWKLEILTLDIQKLLKGFLALIEATQVIIKLIFLKSGIA